MSAVDLSIRQIAAETRINRETVRDLIAEAGIEPVGKRGGHPTFRLRDVLDVLYAAERTDPEQMPPVLRDAWYRGEARRIAIAKATGELCHRDTVVTLVTSMFGATTDALMLLPARNSYTLAAASGGDPGKLAAALERVVREELTQAGKQAGEFCERFKLEHTGRISHDD